MEKYNSVFGGHGCGDCEQVSLLSSYQICAELWDQVSQRDLASEEVYRSSYCTQSFAFFYCEQRKTKTAKQCS